MDFFNYTESENARLLGLLGGGGGHYDDIPLTEVHYLLEVSWQMCHAWITHWMATRAPPTMPRRRCPDDEARATNACTVEMRANPFWHAPKPVWHLKRPFLNCGARDECANRRTEHDEHPTYQIKHS